MKKPDDSPDMAANAWGKLRSYLAKQKYSQEWITNAIGSDRNRPRVDIVEDLKEALKNEV